MPDTKTGEKGVLLFQRSEMTERTFAKRYPLIVRSQNGVTKIYGYFPNDEHRRAFEERNPLPEGASYEEGEPEVVTGPHKGHWQRPASRTKSDN